MFQGIMLKDSDPGFKIVTLCHTKENFKDYYAFYAVEPGKYISFRQKISSGIAPEDKCAELLFRGEGNSPSLKVLQMIKARYDIRKEVSDPIVRKAMAWMNPQETPAKKNISA